MSLRLKIRMSVAFVMALFVLAAWAAARVIVIDGLERLEKNEACLNLKRAANVVWLEAESLNSKCGDWSMWDDTWNFLNGDYPGYPQDNLMAKTFETYGVSMMIFLDADRRIVYAGSYDPQSGEVNDAPASLKHLLLQTPTLTSFSKATDHVKGILCR